MVRRTRPRLENLFFELHSHIRDTDGLHADAALDEVCKVLHGRLAPGLRPTGAFDEPSGLSDAALARVTDCLDRFPLADARADLRADLSGRAFQRLLAPALRAGMGQYFTPDPVVRFMVDALRPAPGERVLDPFCGSAAFLASSLRQGVAPGDLFGIEKSRRMTRIAATDMHLRGAAGARVLCADSLLPFDRYAELEPASFDVVLTNPPFGSILDAASVATLAPFDLAPQGRSVPLEVLGLERAIEFLRPGGRLGIVLPDGVLSNKTSQPVRDWLAEHVVLHALVGLPVETFQPFGASVKTSVLFATRRAPGEPVCHDYPVHVARVASVGYDAAGRSAPSTDLDDAASALRAFLAGGEAGRTTAPFERLLARGRWQVEYFAGRPPPTTHFRYPTVSLGELVTERREMVNPADDPERDIVYVGLEHVERDCGDLVGFAPRPGAAIRSRSKRFREGDVLYGRLRPYLNKVYLPYGPAADGVCSGEFYVLTPDTRRVDPRYLREMLASPLVSTLATRCQSGAALPRVSLADLLALSIPLPPRDVQARIADRLHATDATRRALKEELASLPAETSEWLARELDGEAH